MKNKKGFTLVELLVVIAIIAILAAVVAPNAFKAIEKSKITAIEADFRTIKTATLMYFSDVGTWPETDAGKVGFVEDKASSSEIPGWNGPYLDVWPTKAPLGTGYAFVNEDIATADIATAVNGTSNGIYLQIKDLPETAFERLKKDLGEAQVFSASTTFPTNVYLLIANK